MKHPYDVGDRVDVDGKQLVVTRIALLFTVFRNIADHRVTQVPNIVLNAVWIENITRSEAMREQMTIAVDFGTTFGDIQLLRSEMQKFVLDKDNCRDFQPDVDIEVIGISEMDKLELQIEIRHKSNWSNESVRATRRSKFMCALVLALRKVPIYGPAGSAAALGDMAKPSYSVAISEEKAQANRDDYDKGLEGARMIPTDEMDRIAALAAGEDPKTTAKASGNDHGTEGAFVGALTARQPAMDRARADEKDLYRMSSVSSRGRRSADHAEEQTPGTEGTLPDTSRGHRKEGRTSLGESGAPATYPSSSSTAALTPTGSSSPYSPPPTIPTIVEPTGSPVATPPLASSSGSRTDYYEYNDYNPAPVQRQPSPGNPFGRQASQQPQQQQQQQQEEDTYYQTASSTTVTPMRRPAPGSSAPQQPPPPPPQGNPPRGP